MKYEKVAIVGTRWINTYVQNLIYEYIMQNEIKHLVTGDAEGVDSQVRGVAESFHIPFTVFGAHWNKHGKAAGPIRNKQICEFADRLVAFWDGKSKGTKNSIETMKKLGKPVEVIKYD